MRKFQVGDIIFDIDDDGFIQQPDLWNSAVADALATTEGVEQLTEEHWTVLNYLREYYIAYGSAPMIRKLVKGTGVRLKRIYELFPNGPAMGACKVAGLPRPTGCV
jgi:dissimilatory sulfite reductase related protein